MGGVWDYLETDLEKKTEGKALRKENGIQSGYHHKIEQIRYKGRFGPRDHGKHKMQRPKIAKNRKENKGKQKKTKENQRKPKIC